MHVVLLSLAVLPFAAARYVVLGKQPLAKQPGFNVSVPAIKVADYPARKNDPYWCCVLGSYNDQLKEYCQYDMYPEGQEEGVGGVLGDHAYPFDHPEHPQAKKWQIEQPWPQCNMARIKKRGEPPLPPSHKPGHLKRDGDGDLKDSGVLHGGRDYLGHTGKPDKPNYWGWPPPLGAHLKRKREASCGIVAVNETFPVARNFSSGCFRVLAQQSARHLVQLSKYPDSNVTKVTVNATAVHVGINIKMKRADLPPDPDDPSLMPAAGDPKNDEDGKDDLRPWPEPDYDTTDDNPWLPKHHFPSDSFENPQEAPPEPAPPGGPPPQRKIILKPQTQATDKLQPHYKKDKRAVGDMFGAFVDRKLNNLIPEELQKLQPHHKNDKRGVGDVVGAFMDRKLKGLIPDGMQPHHENDKRGVGHEADSFVGRTVERLIPKKFSQWLRKQMPENNCHRPQHKGYHNSTECQGHDKHGAKKANDDKDHEKDDKHHPKEHHKENAQGGEDHKKHHEHHTDHGEDHKKRDNGNDDKQLRRRWKHDPEEFRCANFMGALLLRAAPGDQLSPAERECMDKELKKKGKLGEMDKRSLDDEAKPKKTEEPMTDEEWASTREKAQDTWVMDYQAKSKAVKDTEDKVIDLKWKIYTQNYTINDRLRQIFNTDLHSDGLQLQSAPNNTAPWYGWRTKMTADIQKHRREEVKQLIADLRVMQSTLESAMVELDKNQAAVALTKELGPFANSTHYSPYANQEVKAQITRWEEEQEENRAKRRPPREGLVDKAKHKIADAVAGTVA